MSILLQDIWPIEDLTKYKVHFARWNTLNQPLEVLTRDKREWQEWQEYRPKRNEFSREYIFSLAQFYHEPGTWLFGGLFRVLARHDNKYEVEKINKGSQFVERLKLLSPYRGRSTRVNLENHYTDFEVAEILREPFCGRSFPGYEEIDISFDELETLVKTGRQDWKAALESIKGIYLITDIKNGKKYVGSASGEQGLWSRWCSYIQTGHGGNTELKNLVHDPSLKYCRSYFRFALLEHRFHNTPDEIILRRENFWKRILLTRGEQGLNRN